MITDFIAKITAWALDEEGASAIEYALIAAGISVAIVAVVFLLGDDIKGVFENLESRFLNR